MDISSEELSSFVGQYDGVDRDFTGIPDDKLPSLPGRCAQDLSGWLTPNDDATERIAVRDMPGGVDGCGIVLENVLTRQECQRIIEHTEKVGYAPIGEARRGAVSVVRNNRWLQADDTSGQLGEEIWRRIRSFIPLQEQLPDEKGTWEAVGVNNNYRFAKYSQHYGPTEFTKHIDRPTVYEHTRVSVYTVNIYLNDLSEEQGGKTRFWSVDRPGGLGKPVDAAGGVAGSICLFKQAVVPTSPWHDGEPLSSGLKYLMRTDVIFNKTEAP